MNRKIFFEYKKYNRNEKKHHFLLDGLLVCYKCKHKIGVRARKNGRLDMICNNYRRNSKLRICLAHGFNYEELENKIIKYIRDLFFYIDKLDNKVSEEMYNRLFNKMQSQIKQKQKIVMEMILKKK